MTAVMNHTVEILKLFSLSLILGVSESEEDSEREDSVMGWQVKVNLVELFRERFKEFGHIMERNGIRNEECG